jgi:hypothetical protein
VVRRSALSWFSLGLVAAGTLVVPLGLRAVGPFLRSPKAAPSYIPSVESPRERAPFAATVPAGLARNKPDYIILGDSMGVSRIDAPYLSRLVGGRGVQELFEAARGSVYWYLAFKNWVVGAGIRPKAVIFFFRDENLTDPLFRLWTGTLDPVAVDQEPRLDQILALRTNGPYYRVHRAAETLYQFDAVSEWLGPRLRNAPAALVAGSGARGRFVDTMNDTVFALDALRTMALADMQAADDAALDFQKVLPASVLPEIIRLSKESGIRVVFVRVQRRPTPTGPPPQSPALQRYVRDLSRYLLVNGAEFCDDWGDPDEPLSIYEDGDHINRDYRSRYTELFVRKYPGIFR